MLVNHVNNHLKNIFEDENDRKKGELEFSQLINDYQEVEFDPILPLSEDNVYLITYGDSFICGDEPTLSILKKVAETYLQEIITDIHILPMFPYTSDDGFSVTDYYKINPKLGDWSHVKDLAKSKRLMFDFVANHMSKSSKWFNYFLNNKEGFEKSFVEFDEKFESSQVVRPRTSQLYHVYENDEGMKKKVWSTFSEDQVDVNVSDPKMLARLTKVLIEYIRLGASSIRLDAIGFLWKKSGTSCIHLDETHEIVKMWRTIAEYYSPNIQIITETNVPHKENISYFNQGNEATQVYQFPLPPLVLYTFIDEDTTDLNKWATDIKLENPQTTYFNFLASHDGIGIRPVENVLTQEKIDKIITRVKENNGKISYKNNTDGSKSVYELNINYGDALRSKNDSDDVAIKKIIAAHHILLSIIGVPAIYYHSIFGSRGDIVGVEESGINRRINREKIDYQELKIEIEENSFRKNIYKGITKLIKIRKTTDAFSPYGKQEIVNGNKELFIVKRFGKNNKNILSVTNVGSNKHLLENIDGIDLITGNKIQGQLNINPYDTFWVEIGE